MCKPAPRRRPQIHLLTLVTLSLTAGWWGWLNTRVYEIADPPGFKPAFEALPPQYGRGWPAIYQDWRESERVRRYHFDAMAAALNVVGGLSLLVIVGASMERFMRKRDPRKDAEA